MKEHNVMNRRLLIILGLVVVFIAAYRLGLFDFMTLENLKGYAEELHIYVKHHYIKAVFIYCLVYVVSITLSFPWAALMTLAGGYMFGMIGVLYIIISTTIGAIGAFLIARYLLGDYLQKKYGKYLRKFNEAMKYDGGWYLFTIRLIPIFPFFIVNSLAGLTKISLRDYMLGTFFGMILPTSIFAFAGTELATIHAVNDVFSWKVLLALGLTVLISLVPLFYRRFLRNFN